MASTAIRIGFLDFGLDMVDVAVSEGEKLRFSYRSFFINHKNNAQT